VAELPGLGKLGAVPKDITDAVVRELVSVIPVLGDLFLLYEAFEAFRQNKAVEGLIYLVNALPGPTLPLTHILVYMLSKGGG